MTADSACERVLVIKLGALGDIIQTFDAFHAIRRHHPNADIQLMTMPSFAGFTVRMPWFNGILTDPRGRSPASYWRIRRLLREGKFTAVYDLQNQPRTWRYRWLMAPGPWPRWIGGQRFSARAKLQPGTVPPRNRDLFMAQLASAGIPGAGPAPLSWLDAPVDHLMLPENFVLMVPGCSPHLPHKRWPAAHYAVLAQRLAGQGMASVAVGTGADRDAIAAITTAAPAVMDLSGRTSLFELAGVARRARAVVGNDTGPVFLTAALGTPTLMLMSHHTNPARAAPVGPKTAWLKRDDLATLSVDDVSAALAALTMPGNCI